MISHFFYQHTGTSPVKTYKLGNCESKLPNFAADVALLQVNDDSEDESAARCSLDLLDVKHIAQCRCCPSEPGAPLSLQLLAAEDDHQA